MPDMNSAKLAASKAAIELVQDGMRIGLGTGSTAFVMVRELAARVKAEGLAIRCASTSKATAELAESLGLSIETLDQIGWLDLTIDGADEVDSDLNLIKGGGAAHLREKVVAMASDRMVVIADAGKVVERLGAFPLPVEALAFGFETTQELIRRGLHKLDYPAVPIRARRTGDDLVITDEGNYILDLFLDAITDAAALAQVLSAIPGVVEHGLFLGICDTAIIGRTDGTAQILRRAMENEEA